MQLINPLRTIRYIYPVKAVLQEICKPCKQFSCKTSEDLALNLARLALKMKLFL